MDWANERYVRVYTRETVDDAALSWEARALWHELIKRLDRAGVMAIGRHGTKGVAMLIRWPTAKVKEFLPELLDDGRIEFRALDPHSEMLVAPNFILAQECKQSDKQRQRDSRERHRDLARAADLGILDPNVTGAVKIDENVTGAVKPSQERSNCHTASHDVTPSLAVPSQPSLAKPGVEPAAQDSSAGGPPPLPGEKQLKSSEQKKLLFKHRVEAERLWELQEELRRVAGGKRLVLRKPTAERLLLVAQRLDSGNTPKECEHVLYVYYQEAKQRRASGDGKAVEWLNGVTNWRKDNFLLKLGQERGEDNTTVHDEVSLKRYREFVEKKKAEYFKKHGTL